jgi:hypothetical protein
MTYSEIEVAILAGVVLSLVALGAALLRKKKSDPKMAFLMALLQDLPRGGGEASEPDESNDAHEPVHSGSGPGSRISDFFA